MWRTLQRDFLYPASAQVTKDNFPVPANAQIAKDKYSGPRNRSSHKRRLSGPSDRPSHQKKVSRPSKRPGHQRYLSGPPKYNFPALANSEFIKAYSPQPKTTFQSQRARNSPKTTWCEAFFLVRANYAFEGPRAKMWLKPLRSRF